MSGPVVAHQHAPVMAPGERMWALRRLAPPPGPMCPLHTIPRGTPAARGTDLPVSSRPVSSPSPGSSVSHTLMSTPFTPPSSPHTLHTPLGVDFKAKDTWRMIIPQSCELKFQPWEGILVTRRTPYTPSSLEPPHSAGAAQMRVKILSRVILKAACQRGVCNGRSPPHARGRDSAGRLAGAACMSVGRVPWPQSCAAQGCLHPSWVLPCSPGLGAPPEHSIPLSFLPRLHIGISKGP